MKFSDCVQLLKENNLYAGDIEFGADGEFIGFVYAKNMNYSDEESQIQFATPIQCSQYPHNKFGDNIAWFLRELSSHCEENPDCEIGEGFDVYGEDCDGREGSCSLSIQEVVEEALKCIEGK